MAYSQKVVDKFEKTLKNPEGSQRWTLETWRQRLS